MPAPFSPLCPVSCRSSLRFHNAILKGSRRRMGYFCSQSPGFRLNDREHPTLETVLDIAPQGAFGPSDGVLPRRSPDGKSIAFNLWSPAACLAPDGPQMDDLLAESADFKKLLLYDFQRGGRFGLPMTEKSWAAVADGRRRADQRREGTTRIGTLPLSRSAQNVTVGWTWASLSTT